MSCSNLSFSCACVGLPINMTDLKSILISHLFCSQQSNMTKFVTALVLVSLIAITLATAYPPRRNKNNGAVYRPAFYNAPKKGYEPSYVHEKKYYSPPSSYDMLGYASESAPYYQKEGYNAQSYVMKGSNYGRAYNTPYQKPKAYGGYTSY